VSWVTQAKHAGWAQLGRPRIPLGQRVAADRRWGRAALSVGRGAATASVGAAVADPQDASCEDARAHGYASQAIL